MEQQIDVRNEPPGSASARLIENWSAILMAAGFLGLAIGMVWMATGFSAEPRRLPLVVGVPFLVMSAANLVIIVATSIKPELKRAKKGKDLSELLESALADEGPGEDDDGETPGRKATKGGLKLWAAIASVVVISILFILFGQLIASVVFTIGFMKIVGRDPLWKGLVSSAVIVLFFYAFWTFLNVRPYRGYLVTEMIIPYVLPF